MLPTNAAKVTVARNPARIMNVMSVMNESSLSNSGTAGRNASLYTSREFSEEPAIVRVVDNGDYEFRVMRDGILSVVDIVVGPRKALYCI
jgi:hypothetical protein